MKYKVPIKSFTIELVIVEAHSKEEAMNKALDGDYEEEIDVIDGDPEVYYPDIQEIK